VKEFKPFDYQSAIRKHIMFHPRCAIWAGMGTGKTSSTLHTLDSLALVRETFPVLVLAPLRVATTTWIGELQKWANFHHLKMEVCVGDPATRKSRLKRDADLYAINYENLQWLTEHLGEQWPFVTIVADESTRLKNFRLNQGGKRSKALASVAWKSKRFIELTGTPSPNGLKDLWGQIWFLDQGRRLGRTYTAFRDRWFYPGPDGFGVFPKECAEDEIKALLSDICLSIEAKDYLDLPELVSSVRLVDLPPNARTKYDQMEKEMFTQIEGSDIEAFNAAAKTQKCLQLASGAVYIDSAGNWEEVHTAKIEELQSVIEEINGANLIVAYHFKSDLARLKKAFPHGRELDKNPRTILDWNAGKIPLMFLHPASAGHGLNLQDGGHHICYFSNDWNLENYLQAIERIGPTRQKQSGYDRPVYVVHLVGKDTIEERVVDARIEKRAVQDALMDYMKVKTT
jgi:SNF2 family DNA or RNA helicase